MEEYINKIRRSFNNYLREYFLQVTEIEVRGLRLEINKFISSFPPEINLKSIKLHELLSGDPVTINIHGTFQVNQKIVGGSRNRFIDFWADDCTVRFDNTSEDFEIINVPRLLYIDFNQ